MLESITILIACKNQAFGNELMNSLRNLPLNPMNIQQTSKPFMPELLQNSIDILFLELTRESVEFLKSDKDPSPLLPEIILIAPKPKLSDVELAFESEVVELLTKIPDSEKLNRILMRAKKRILQKTGSFDQSDTLNEGGFICYTRNHKDYYIKEDLILYVEKTSKRCIHFILRTGEVIESTSLLEEIRLQSSDKFFSPHRSYIINTKYVNTVMADSLISGNYLLTLAHCPTIIPLTRTRYPLYRQTYIKSRKLN